MKISGYILYSLAFGLLTLASCSGDDIQTENIGKDIKLSAGWGDKQTRAKIDEANRDIMNTGENVYAWADMINSTDNQLSSYFKAWHLHARSDGQLVAVTAAKQFPAANKLNFYAVNGDFDAGQITEGTTEMPASLTYRVEANQTTANNYYVSDLLYGMRKQVEPTENDVELPFYHMLSQVRVLVKAGAEVTASQLANCTVLILNAKCRGTFSPDTTDVAAENIATTATRAAMISTDNSTQNVTMKTGSESAFQADDDMVSAIIPPQTYAAGAGMIKVILSNNDEFVFKPTADLVLESGGAYKIVITINDGKAQGIVTTLAGWANSTDDNSINFERTL